ncbi:MAG: FAD binding domain-containing protein [Thermodesulfobacteriota bacterium]
MKNFDYLRPASLDEALDLLAEHGPRANLVAGGTDVLVEARKGGLEAEVLVSLTRLEDLRYIREDRDSVAIGGLTTLRDLEQSELIAAGWPALSEAVKNMASVQIRNRATMAGNVVNAAPSADTAPPLLVSEARARLVSKAGQRLVPLTEFFVGPKATVIAPGEVLTEFVLPRPAEAYSQAFYKHSRRRAMDLAMINAAVHLELEPDLATCREARIALGVAAPTPIRTPEAEARLKGQKVTAEILDRIGDASCQESACRDSLRGQAWYRQEMIRVTVRRLGLLALERARAKVDGRRGGRG